MTALDDYITTHEAAKIIGVSHSTVTRYCASGRLPSEWMGFRLLIKRRDAKKCERAKRGYPSHMR